MLALVAVLLANADGRSGIALSRLLSARSDRRVTVGIAFGPALAERPAARSLRWAAAAILAIWGLRTALGAFGLIG